jgi:beta-ureidopropionase / N-carbamoyl-L-amino-acid hydrolase
MDAREIARAVEARLPWAEALFARIREISVDGPGVTRPAFSPEDRKAIEIIAEAAQALDLELDYDAAGNLYATLPGRNRNIPAILAGSHVDSVPKGGNFDGLAGVLAGFTTLAAFRDLGITPDSDVTAVALTGEESVWYGIAYVGSRLATGALPLEELDSLKRLDTGRSLGEHMAESGCDLAALRSSQPRITAENARAWLEIHIEQATALIQADSPAAVPTTIRGNVRFPLVRCEGAYAHSAAEPRATRQDAVLASVELIAALEKLWHERETQGVPDTVLTVGILHTDPDEHAMTKVPGLCSFSLNFGGTTTDFLDECRARTYALAEEIGRRRRVRFDLGTCVGSNPIGLDAGLRETLRAQARALGIEAPEFATVGHDAGVMQRAGVPSAMILVRNQNGSHNPYEAMEMADFGAAVGVLANTILAIE